MASSFQRPGRVDFAFVGRYADETRYGNTPEDARPVRPVEHSTTIRCRTHGKPLALGGAVRPTRRHRKILRSPDCGGNRLAGRPDRDGQVHDRLPVARSMFSTPIDYPRLERPLRTKRL